MEEIREEEGGREGDGERVWMNEDEERRRTTRRSSRPAQHSRQTGTGGERSGGGGGGGGWWWWCEFPYAHDSDYALDHDQRRPRQTTKTD